MNTCSIWDTTYATLIPAIPFSNDAHDLLMTWNIQGFHIKRQWQTCLNIIGKHHSLGT
jgi:hypothetical protein